MKNNGIYGLKGTSAYSNLSNFIDSMYESYLDDVSREMMENYTYFPKYDDYENMINFIDAVLKNHFCEKNFNNFVINQSTTEDNILEFIDSMYNSYVELNKEWELEYDEETCFVSCEDLIILIKNIIKHYFNEHEYFKNHMDENVNEAALKKVKAIQGENKQFKAIISKIKKLLQMDGDFSVEQEE